MHERRCKEKRGDADTAYVVRRRVDGEELIDLK